MSQKGCLRNGGIFAQTPIHPEEPLFEFFWAKYLRGEKSNFNKKL